MTPEEKELIRRGWARPMAYEMEGGEMTWRAVPFVPIEATQIERALIWRQHEERLARIRKQGADKKRGKRAATVRYDKLETLVHGRMKRDGISLRQACQKVGSTDQERKTLYERMRKKRV